MSPALVVLSIICCVLAVMMLFAKNPITTALCLLGVLLMSAGIYGLIGEHLIATVQLVVYAGAIMVLFIFSIMLLNMSKDEKEFSDKPGLFFGGIVLGFIIFGLITFALNHHFIVYHPKRVMGPFSQEVIAQLGGNSKVLAHALFSQFYVSFEVISLALLVAIVGAVVLAKRKFD
jgi:NADH-quinone oxidoreductase subunit J